MRIDHGTATPLYQQIAAEIRRQIVEGKLAVGERLPPHRELAKRLGVSLITINKALSGLVSEGVLNSRVGFGTTVAVRPAALAVPTLGATSTPGGRTLGFVLRDLNSPYFSALANECERHAHAHGYDLLMLSSGNVAEREDGQLRRLLAAGVEGLLVVSMSRTTYTLSESLLELQAQRFPFAMVSYTVGDRVPYVGMDAEAAGALAAQHLVTLGRRRLGFVTDRFGSLSGEARSAGYRRVVRDHGLVLSDGLVFEYPYEGEWNDYRSGRELGVHIAGRTERPDALFVFNDLGALGIIDGLTAAGVRVPDDVAVIGIDGIAMGAHAPVPLTTIRSPVDQIGAHAVQAVLAQIQGAPWSFPDLLTPTLIVRESCGAPPRLRTREVTPDGAGNTARPFETLAEHGQRELARLASLAITAAPGSPS
jgi:DNA-binding LacI/PurR family transcriptional regulator